MRLSDTAGRLLLAIVIITLIIIAAGFAYYRSVSAFSFALSAVVLAGVNIFRVWSLDRSVAGTVNRDGKKTPFGFVFMYLTRFLLTGAALIVAVMNPYMSVWGAIWGVAVWPVAVFASSFIKRTGSAPKED